MGKAEYKVSGGKLIRVKVRKKDGLIEEIKITGDFFMHPEDAIEILEEKIRYQPLVESSIAKAIAEFLETSKVTLLGASPEDLAKCIVMAGEEDG
ncbi:MAG: lipoate protein ligase C-terminal domain-containing protein [Nitrososphaerota archaeon]|nr:hypothetical protein [Candidatus Bathyarchaeota archaeon]MDW8048111.1 lipoate protein ligase C-terminal domain-containing protein [Nitrososphaerota archaeon]